MEYHLTGTTSEVTVDDRGVHIRRTKGPMKGAEKTIPFAQIASVVLKEPSILVGGFLQFQPVGYAGHGLHTPAQAAGDENTVVFAKKGYDHGNVHFQQQFRRFLHTNNPDIFIG